MVACFIERDEELECLRSPIVDKSSETRGACERPVGVEGHWRVLLAVWLNEFQIEAWTNTELEFRGNPRKDLKEEGSAQAGDGLA